MASTLPPVNEALKNDVDKKFQTGKEMKEKGDEHFKAGETKEALRQYHLAVMYLQGLDKSVMSAIEGSKTEPGKDKKTESDVLLEKIFSNVCACHIKNGNWKRAEESANQVLKKNPDNDKAKFRKARALAGQGYTEKSIKILEELTQKEPDNAEWSKELASVKAADKAASAKGLSKFKGMFGKAGASKAIAPGDEMEGVVHALEESHIEEVSS